MKVEKKVEIEVKLTMSGKEAQWLKALLQNPLHEHSPENETIDNYETPENYNMRSNFWSRLNSEGV